MRLTHLNMSSLKKKTNKLLQLYRSVPSIQELLVKGRTFKIKVFPLFYTPCFSAMHKSMSRCQKKTCINLLSLTHMFSTTFFHAPSYQHTLLQTYKTQTDFLASEQTPNSIMSLQVEHLGFLQDLRFSVQYSSTVQLFTCP